MHKSRQGQSVHKYWTHGFTEGIEKLVNEEIMVR